MGIAIAAGLVAAGATAYSAYSSSQAQSDAANAQKQSQQDANQTNYNEFLQSRGQGGSAVLPMYLTNPGGSGLFEQSLGNDLVSAYGATNTPYSTFQTAIAPLAPAQSNANQFTNDIFNGGITSKLLAEAQPTQQARLSSSMDALNKTLAAIDVAQAGKGFSGDSYGNRLLEFQGRSAQGDAAVQNLAENQQIRNYGDVTLPMNNLTLPENMANQSGQFAFLPQNDYLQSLQSRIQPFNFIKIGTGNPPAVQPLPTAPPAFGAGQAAAGAIGGLGSTALNYYLGQQASTGTNGAYPTNNYFTPSGGASYYNPATTATGTVDWSNLNSPPAVAVPPPASTGGGGF